MSITPQEHEAIQLYLKEPVSSGLWSVKFNLLEKEAGLYNFFYQKVKLEYESEISEENSSGEQSEDGHIVMPRRSSRFKLRRLGRMLREPERFIDFLYEVVSSVDDEPPILLRNEEIFNEFSEKYKKGLDYFISKFPQPNEENEISARRYRDREITIEGVTIISLHEDNYISTSKDPLIVITELMKIFGIIDDDIKLNMFFSPEEEIIKPYFHYTNLVSKELFDKNTLRIFESSFEEYDSEEFENSISKLGKASEEILVQIYETLFRIPLHEGLTIGQLYDKINKDISNRYRPSKVESADYKEIYPLLKDNNDYDVSIIRKLVGILIANQKYLNQEIKNKNSINKYKHIFPKQIRRNIDELIRYRNAASHKSRAYLGEYETLKMLYDFVSLYLWWKTQYESINWSLSKNDIIDSLVVQE